ncbi:MAG TPA: SURF1 family protein [Longimicrobiales bacterium]
MPSSEAKTLRLSRRGVIGSVLVVLIALTCVRLGFWQLHRLDYKRHRNAVAHARMRLAPVQLSALRLDSAGLIYRRASVSGSYDDERVIIVAGRSLDGAPGVHVLTPLRVGNAGVLVNRGWMPSADAATIDARAVREPAPRHLSGLILDLPFNPRSAESDSAGAFRHTWYRVDVRALQKQFPYPLANYVVQLLPAPDAPRLPRRLPLPALDEGPHLGYAVQWFSFALIGIVGWLILLRRK